MVFFKGSFEVSKKAMNIEENESHSLVAGAALTYLVLVPAVLYFYLASPSYDWLNIQFLTLLLPVLFFAWPTVLFAAIVISKKHY